MSKLVQGLDAEGVLLMSRFPHSGEVDGSGEPSGPPVTRMGRMVMYSMKGLEQYMEERTVEGR